MSRPVNKPLNSANQIVNFGVNWAGVDKAQGKYQDVPQRTALVTPIVTGSPPNAFSSNLTGTLTIQEVQCDTVYVSCTGSTGGVYVLPPASDFLNAFSDFNLGKAVRIWFINTGSAFVNIVGNPGNGADITYNTARVTQVDTTDGTVPARPVYVQLTSLNGSPLPQNADPLPMPGSTGTYTVI